MNIRHTLTAFAVGVVLMANPAFSGGPVITEDAYTTEAPRDDRKIGGLVVGLITIVALIALANGGDHCTVEETPVEPEQPSGCR